MPFLKQSELRKWARKSPEPTEAQREAGNYEKGHIRFHGLDIAIETPKGRRRRPGWPPMAAHYGYIKRTLARDGDSLDVFIGPNEASELVYVIDQSGPSGKRFDEHKIMLGFDTQSDAVDTYRKCYTPGWTVGPVSAMTIIQFKAWLEDGDHKKPLHCQVSKYASIYDAIVAFERYAGKTQMAFNWDEAEHPRAPKGNGDGGQFVSKARKPVSVSQLRDLISSVRDSLASHRSAANDKEKSREAEYLKRNVVALAQSHSPGANSHDMQRYDEMLSEAVKAGAIDAFESHPRRDWQKGVNDYIDKTRPDIEQKRSSDGTGGKLVPRIVGKAYSDHKQKVAAALDRGEAVPDEVASEHGLESDKPTKTAEWNNDRGLSLSVDRGFSFWNDGIPFSHTRAKDSGKVEIAAEFLKKEGPSELSVKFEHHGDRKLAKSYMAKIQKLAETAGYTASDEKMRTEQGHEFPSHSVVTLTKIGDKPKRELKPGYVEQPRAKAGGEVSSVDGVFYRGGALMPVHGLFSGQEKPVPVWPHFASWRVSAFSEVDARDYGRMVQ